jgi:hypothetical protein
LSLYDCIERRPSPTSDNDRSPGLVRQDDNAQTFSSRYSSFFLDRKPQLSLPVQFARHYDTESGQEAVSDHWINPYRFFVAAHSN